MDWLSTNQNQKPYIRCNTGKEMDIFPDLLDLLCNHYFAQTYSYNSTKYLYFILVEEKLSLCISSLS